MKSPGCGANDCMHVIFDNRQRYHLIEWRQVCWRCWHALFLVTSAVEWISQTFGFVCRWRWPPRNWWHRLSSYYSPQRCSASSTSLCLLSTLEDGQCDGLRVIGKFHLFVSTGSSFETGGAYNVRWWSDSRALYYTGCEPVICRRKEKSPRYWIQWQCPLKYSASQLYTVSEGQTAPVSPWVMNAAQCQIKALLKSRHRTTTNLFVSSKLVMVFSNCINAEWLTQSAWKHIDRRARMWAEPYWKMDTRSDYSNCAFHDSGKYWRYGLQLQWGAVV